MNIDTVWSIVLYSGFIALLLFSFFIFIAPDRFKKGKKYDERQILARNKAYKFSFVFMVLYFTACTFLEIIDIKWAMVPIMLFIGIIGSITLFIIICIIKEAYNDWFTRKNRPYDFLFFSLFYGGLELGNFLWNIYKGESIFTNGMLNENITELVFAVMFLCIFAAKMINSLIKRADEKNEKLET